jgi:hypothetical protein
MSFSSSIDKSNLEQHLLTLVYRNSLSFDKFILFKAQCRLADVNSVLKWFERNRLSFIRQSKVPLVTDLGQAMFEMCIIHNIRSSACCRDEHDDLKTCIKGLPRSHSFCASDRMFNGFMCTRCKHVNSSSAEAYKHHASCFERICTNGCGQKINGTAQSKHASECLMVCQGTKYSYTDAHGKPLRSTRHVAEKTCGYVFQDYQDLINHHKSCEFVASNTEYLKNVYEWHVTTE